MGLHILVENNQNKLAIDEKMENFFKETLNTALDIINFQKDVELNLYFTDNEEIRVINKEQRGIDKATDVLSFPMADVIKGNLVSDNCDRNPENNLLMLGDIIISTEKAIEQAKDYGHSIEREIMFLFTHGIFHVLGYDHQNSEDEREMIQKTEAVLSILGISRS
jgi:probable rRNA maturation factor